MVNELISVDASEGGQLLRTALAFSAVLRREVRVFNIRAKRPNPGLQAQHLTAIKTLAELTSASVSPYKIGSSEIVFRPQDINAMRLNVNIGTAGSISLLLQSIMLPALLKQLRMRVSGGTDVAWSPTFNYMKHVLLPTLGSMNARYELSLTAHGYYPKGRGVVSFSSLRSRLPLLPIKITECGSLEELLIFSHSSSLPREVALNQAAAARKVLAGLDAPVTEAINYVEAAETTGSGIDIVAVFSSGARIAANALGQKGKAAAAVGREAAEKLLAELEACAPVDSHLADQLIPFMAIAKGESRIRCTRLTEHTLSNIRVTEAFLGRRFDVKGEKGRPAEISAEGIAFTGYGEQPPPLQ